MTTTATAELSAYHGLALAVIAAPAAPAPERDRWLHAVGLGPHDGELAATLDAEGHRLGGSAWRDGPPFAHLPTTPPREAESIGPPPGCRFTIYRPGTHDLALTSEQCHELIDSARHSEQRAARGGTSEHRVTLAWCERWAAQLMATAGAAWWPYTLTSVELSVLRYPPGAYCPRHVDNIPGAGHWRRLSASVALSDPADYQGGALVLDYGLPLAVELGQGAACVFAASTLHSVEPVADGERWA